MANQSVINSPMTGAFIGVDFTVEIQRLDSIISIGVSLETLRKDLVWFGATIDGQWDDAITYFKTFKERANLLLGSANKLAANVYRTALKRTWENQTLPWVPLDTDYLGRKIAQGLDRRINLATDNVLDHIEIQKPGPFHFRVGVSAINSENLFPYMNSLEFGARQAATGGFTPERPILGPTLDIYQRQLVEIYRTALTNVLNNTGADGLKGMAGLSTIVDANLPDFYLPG